VEFPKCRLRRLRSKETIRRLVSETELNVNSLIMPYFVREGKGIVRPIVSMPGNYQWTIDKLVKEVEEAKTLGINGIILFGVPLKKDEIGSSSFDKNGIIQKAVQALKKAIPEVIVITDVCLCEYTSHGHCGIVREKKAGGKKGFEVDNDATLKILAKAAVSHVQAGADIVAPSGMMDGMVLGLREALDKRGFINTLIMSYSAKYASSFYSPFREAAESPPAFGDRKTYQMDMRNSNEALREVEQDIKEGADIVMVKPALAYQDIIYRVKERFGCPVACYNVSGEFAMVKSAAQKGLLDEKSTVLELLTGFRRSGADIIITYWAKDAARWMR